MVYTESLSILDISTTVNYQTSHRIVGTYKTYNNEHDSHTPHVPRLTLSHAHMCLETHTHTHRQGAMFSVQCCFSFFVA